MQELDNNEKELIKNTTKEIIDEVSRFQQKLINDEIQMSNEDSSIVIYDIIFMKIKNLYIRTKR